MKQVWIVLALLVPCLAYGAAPIKRDEPIQVNSDKLDVFQNEHKAIFTGNVIATQGTTTMRAVEMTVFYRDSAAKEGQTAPQTTEKASTPEGIYRLEAKGNVVFTTPTETALGDFAVYNVDTDTIDVTGKDVTLTRGQNVLKGTKLNYNMGTGRSVLTGGAADKPSRVRGLFVPKSDKAGKQ